MKRSIAHGAGYTIIDHRDSPGVTPEDLAHIAGGMAFAVPGGKVGECDVLGCGHCQAQVVKHPQRVRPRGYCPKCDRYVCDRCEAIRVRTSECVPYMKILDAIQNAAEKYEGREDHPDATPKILLTDLLSQ